jgi:hypothetical protein
MRPEMTTRSKGLHEASTATRKNATLTEVRTAMTEKVTAGANVAIQAVALEADADVDPALVQGHEIARGPGRALQHVAHVGLEAVIQGQDRGQDPEVHVAGVEAEAEMTGALTITMLKMDTGFTLLIWTVMLANATSRSFLANMDPSKKSGWPDLCLALLL